MPNIIELKFDTNWFMPEEFLFSIPVRIKKEGKLLEDGTIQYEVELLDKEEEIKKFLKDEARKL